MNTSATQADHLTNLRDFAREAAEWIRPRAARMDLEGYCSFLSAMYHYTRGTGEKARVAGRNCPHGEIRRFFEHMEREEEAHYLLAQSDLNALGYDVHPDKPAAVEAFDRYWASIRPEHYRAYVGALVVFENIARHLGPDIAELLRRLRLPRTQSRWLRAHARADEQHGRQALAIAERHMHDDPRSLLQGAQRACELWKEIFRSALEDPIAVARRAEPK